MLTPDFLKAKFDQARPYDVYVATGKPAHQDNWRNFHGQVRLTSPQRTLIGSFMRRINVLVSSGTWCGDCVQQCPMLAHIEGASPPDPREPGSRLIRVRLLDRDEHKDLSERVLMCGGLRVPTVIFMNEDFDFCGILGDRSLARYRAIAARQLGPSCPLPGAPVPPDEIAATLQDWVNEFERVHLMLRLSPKLRERHRD